MKWLVKRLYRKEKGFTLIELLIVIIILAVLAGIAIPSYLSITNRAKRSATQAELSGIATALEIYNADESAYPNVTTFAAMSALISPAYMQTIPSVDKWNNLYTYTSDGTTYSMSSTNNKGTTLITFTDGQMTSDGE